MNRILQIVFFSLITALTACGQFSIDVAPSQVSLKSGESQQFTVSVSNAQNPNGIWSATGGTIDSERHVYRAGVTSDQVLLGCFHRFAEWQSQPSRWCVYLAIRWASRITPTVPNSSMASSTPAPGKNRTGPSRRVADGHQLSPIAAIPCCSRVLIRARTPCPRSPATMDIGSSSEHPHQIQHCPPKAHASILVMPESCRFPVGQRSPARLR
jgi:hypothetical protein